MTVEIKELIIRAVAERKQDSRRPLADPAPAEIDKDTIVAECVKEVLRIVKKSRER